MYCLICLCWSADNSAEGFWYPCLSPLLMREVKTAIYSCLHACSVLFLPPLVCDKRPIDSETDTLGCVLAAYQQRSVSSSFRTLSALMKDGSWNSMTVIGTVAPRLPPHPLNLVHGHTALSVPHQELDQANPMFRGNDFFLDLCPISMGPLYLPCISHHL